MSEGNVFTIYDGSSYEVLERPKSPDGALVMRFRLIDHCSTPPPHIHPHSVETFEVEDGSFELLVGSEWRTVAAREKVEVPPGTRHTFRNHSGSEVVVRNVHDPHADFESYIRKVAALTHEYELTAPDNPAAAARMAMIWQRHTDLIQPADLPLKIAFPVLSALGRLLRLSLPSG